MQARASTRVVARLLAGAAGGRCRSWTGYFSGLVQGACVIGVPRRNHVGGEALVQGRQRASTSSFCGMRQAWVHVRGNATSNQPRHRYNIIDRRPDPPALAVARPLRRWRLVPPASCLGSGVRRRPAFMESSGRCRHHCRGRGPSSGPARAHPAASSSGVACFGEAGATAPVLATFRSSTTRTSPGVSEVARRKPKDLASASMGWFCSRTSP